MLITVLTISGRCGISLLDLSIVITSYMKVYHENIGYQLNGEDDEYSA